MQLYIYISLAKACDENPESPGSLAVTSLSSPLRFSGASSPAWGLTCSRSPQGSHQSTWHSSGTRLPAGMCCKTRTLLDHRNPRSQWALVLIASTRLPVHVCVCVCAIHSSHLARNLQPEVPGQGMDCRPNYTLKQPVGTPEKYRKVRTTTATGPSF